jgi:hypothetical protein
MPIKIEYLNDKNDLHSENGVLIFVCLSGFLPVSVVRIGQIAV